MKRPRDVLAVLVWHNVASTSSSHVPSGSGPRGLARQLGWLQRRANVLDLGDALDTLAADDRLPPRAVAVTFDDGYRDGLELAAPMLERLGLAATFFLAPAFLNGTAVPWWEVVSRAMHRSVLATITIEGETFDVRSERSRRALIELLKRSDHDARLCAVRDLVRRLTGADPDDLGVASDLLLDWGGASELVEHGFAIGSHSMEHRILAREQADVQAEDLSESKRLLEEKLAVAVRIVAYPNGKPQDFDDVTERAAREAGYAYGVTTIRGRNTRATPPFRVRRIVMDPERGLAAFAGLCASVVRGEGLERSPARR